MGWKPPFFAWSSWPSPVKPCPSPEILFQFATVISVSRCVITLWEVQWKMVHMDFDMEGYLFCFFRGRFWIFFGVPGSLLFLWFSAFRLLCFSASLLFCFSAYIASLLFLLLCCSAFCFSCFFAFLLLCFPCFSAFVLLCLSTSTILLFLFFSHVFLLLYFLLLCFFASCLYCLFVFHVLLLYSVLFVS